MSGVFDFDATVVGSGPNGLAAAITLAQEGWRVALFEGRDTVGGGMRTLEMTLPGFRHDFCSAVHPLGMASPVFRQMALEVDWIQPDLPLAQPLDDGSAVVLSRSLDQTCELLGVDGQRYRRWIGPVVELWPQLEPMLLGPMLRLPEHPLALARFSLRAGLPATFSGKLLFRSQAARALLAGVSGHSVLPLEALGTSAFALVLGTLAHRVGWPIPRGGSQAIADALVARFRSHGGEVHTGRWIRSIDDLPSSKVFLFDLNPWDLDRLAGTMLSEDYRQKLRRFRPGPAAFKMDWALDGPIPWRNSECARAGTVHLGGTFDEIAASERAIWGGKTSDRPFVILVQPSLFDATRAPEGKHTAWAYCHVPHAWTEDVSAAMVAQVERFAPGFSKLVLAQSVTTPADFETYNPNYLGGDFVGGANDLWQLVARPCVALDPYATSHPRIFLCSSSTSPGGGVHGMCGFHAAQSVLRRYCG